jgi:NADPH2:quinone reductase
MYALTFSRFGGPEVLEYREVPEPVLQPGHAVVELEAIGLNFADLYRRRGTYHLAGEPPYIAGYEGAGRIVAVAGDHPTFAVGDRVAFADSPFAQAERALVELDRLIPLPDDISSETAAALLLQGLTAQYLVRDSHPLQAGETALVHAAAGGVGLLLVQLARAAGARVIGLTSSLQKAEAARQAGVDEVLLYDSDWVQAACQISGGGADVAYDSVGRTLMQSFEAVRTGWRVVFYGMAGGDPPLIDPRFLMDTSKTLTGGDLWNVLRRPEDRRDRAAELFGRVRSGALTVQVAGRFALSDGASAHRLLESRQSSGKVLLIPDHQR